MVACLRRHGSEKVFNEIGRISIGITPVRSARVSKCDDRSRIRTSVRAKLPSTQICLASVAHWLRRTKFPANPRACRAAQTHDRANAERVDHRLVNGPARPHPLLHVLRQIGLAPRAQEDDVASGGSRRIEPKPIEQMQHPRCHPVLPGILSRPPFASISGPQRVTLVEVADRSRDRLIGLLVRIAARIETEKIDIGRLREGLASGIENFARSRLQVTR